MQCKPASIETGLVYGPEGFSLRFATVSTDRETKPGEAGAEGFGG
jgi:hypothetical protein